MENHPIPQDVTGFQFKLIGNMTVKQFSYLAAGTVLAWLFFFILPLPFLIKAPLAIIFLGLGIGFAFVPVEGRPMDVMLMNLIRAMLAPTQYIYKKSGGDLDSAIASNSNRLQATDLQTQQYHQPQTVLNNVPPVRITPPAPQVQAGSFPLHNQPSVIPLDESLDQPPVNISSSGHPENNEDEAEKILENEKKLEDEVDELKKQLEEAKSAETSQQNPLEQSEIHQKAMELEKMLIESQRQREALEKELIALKAKLEGAAQEKLTPSVAEPPKQTQRVRKIPSGMEKTVGLPTAPQDPNLITGIVKDPRGNPLPNILVEVKDMEDNPVRAFKTNGLGQFASATSLSNGKYIMVFEDPGGKNKFDAVQIEATGAPLMPLEIISVDPREELRRELFN